MKMKKETSPNVSQFNDQSPEKIDEAFLSPSKESPAPEKSLASKTYTPIIKLEEVAEEQ